MIYFESRIDKCLTRNVIRAIMAVTAKGKDSLLFCCLFILTNEDFCFLD
jgi:hypothetical protein